MVNIKAERYRAKESKGERLNSLRAGRLTDMERLMILNALGDYARKKYADYVTGNSQGYNLRLIKNGLKFVPDIAAFENDYYIDNGNKKQDDIAAYFENGTGIFNVKYRRSNRDRIKPLHSKMLRFRKKWKGISGAASVAGVRPIYMLRRTLKSIEFNRMHLQRQIRMRLGI